MKWDDVMHSPHLIEAEREAAYRDAEHRFVLSQQAAAADREATRIAKGWPPGVYTQPIADLLALQTRERAELATQLEASRPERARVAATREILLAEPVASGKGAH
jgi:hypothetical protein